VEIDIKVVAKKKFGQNFLKDSTVLTKIIESMPQNSNQLIEIGPGLGDLTERLLDIKSVIAYEVDRDLYSILQDKFSDKLQDARLSLICTDVLEYWEKSPLFNSDYDLVANLPYYISTTIILKALKDKSCKHILVMVQKEVAQKFCATYNEREFCALSVFATSVGEARLLFDVPPTAFDPIPKVTSSVLLIRKSNDFDITKDFEDFLKVAFCQPRKKLQKNLSSKFEKTKLEDIFNSLELSTNVRPHEVDTKTYQYLYNKLK
jgi:16S rRNA (adenine1518-N6/adenine1519-N6)-dimethyltransferase